MQNVFGIKENKNYIKKKETQTAPHPTSASPPMSLRGKSVSSILKPTSIQGKQVSLWLGHLQSFIISLGRLTYLHGERFYLLLLCLPSGLGGSPGEGNGNRLQYSCLENPMDRGA